MPEKFIVRLLWTSFMPFASRGSVFLVRHTNPHLLTLSAFVNSGSNLTEFMESKMKKNGFV